MSLDINSPTTTSVKSDRPLPKSGPQPARVAQIIDLGVQARPAFQGKEKAPVHQVYVNFELVNDTYEYEGKQVKHRIGPKPYSVVSKTSTFYGNSAISKFLSSIDPDDSIKGKLAALVDRPCYVVIAHNEGIGKHQGRKFANITQVMIAPEGLPVAQLSTPPTVFEFDNPTEDSWKAMPKFLQDKVKTALNYKGSKVEALVQTIVA